MDQFTQIYCYALSVIGPCALVFSIVSIFRTRNFIRRSSEVSGKVIRLERSKTRDRYGYEYAPVFSFTTAEGKSCTVTSDVSSSPPGFSIGESVRVRYDPVNPENARIHTFFQTWGIAVISGIVGLAFIGVGGGKLLGILH
jgi:hypothetical protein